MDCGKLIELLNEYEKSVTEIPVYWGQTNGMFQYGSYIQQVSVMYMISKHYGFIKWLVDNDKIDRLTFCTVETPSSKYEDFDLGPETPREDYTNILLMDLAIQDNPIEFLLSILK